MADNDAYTDVVELCALLQCLGFSVKSLSNSDANVSHEGVTRTVVINCQSSGLNVVLENASVSCSCPPPNLHNSGVWQVSGVSGGKQLDKEFGCTLLASLPKGHRERLTKELREMIRCIKQHSDCDLEKPREPCNKSSSMIELHTPKKIEYETKADTPTRYRSLDTLTADKADFEQPLPAPGPLTKRNLAKAYPPDNSDAQKTMCRRQSTYTISSTSESVRRRNKTSSPIQSQNTLLESLVEAEKVADDLRKKLAYVIKEFCEEERNDSSMSSLVLDVSKISVLKAEPSKAQFASSPNLSGLGTLQEDMAKCRLRRIESTSTSSLLPKKQLTSEKTSRLRRISPNIFKLKKDDTKAEKPKPPDNKGSRLHNLFKPKIVTPVMRPPESPNLSASKRKYSHIKSTIPRPSPFKKE